MIDWAGVEGELAFGQMPGCSHTSFIQFPCSIIFLATWGFGTSPVTPQPATVVCHQGLEVKLGTRWTLSAKGPQRKTLCQWVPPEFAPQVRQRLEFAQPHVDPRLNLGKASTNQMYTEWKCVIHPEQGGHIGPCKREKQAAILLGPQRISSPPLPMQGWTVNSHAQTYEESK